MSKASCVVIKKMVNLSSKYVSVCHECETKKKNLSPRKNFYLAQQCRSSHTCFLDTHWVTFAIHFQQLRQHGKQNLEKDGLIEQFRYIKILTWLRGLGE